MSEYERGRRDGVKQTVDYLNEMGAVHFAKHIEELLAATSGTPAPATTPTLGGFIEWFEEMYSINPKFFSVLDDEQTRLIGSLCKDCWKSAQAAAPGGKEPSEYDQCHSNSLFCEKCGICHTEKFPCPRASHPLQDKPPAASVTVCPKCGGRLNTSGGHGEWCPKATCKWGWEVEADGSPLQPPLPAAPRCESFDVEGIMTDYCTLTKGHIGPHWGKHWNWVAQDKPPRESK